MHYATDNHIDYGFLYTLPAVYYIWYIVFVMFGSFRYNETSCFGLFCRLRQDRAPYVIKLSDVQDIHYSHIRNENDVLKVLSPSGQSSDFIAIIEIRSGISDKSTYFKM